MGDLQPGAPELEVSGLAYSSQSVTPGALFFCVPGFRSDGHDFAPDAVERGAVALVCERPLGLGVPELVVDDVRAAMGPVAARFYGDPTSELEVVGITGTNGKTTTAFLVRHMLEAAGRPSGLLGTVKRVVGGEEQEVERTTPEAIDLQATFRAMLDAGDRACAMEVSSHALELGRAAGIRFACRVFTNLTQDHLDFHETMEDYFLAKRRLFEEPGAAVVNVDDEYGRRIAEERPGCVTFAVGARGRLPGARRGLRLRGRPLHHRHTRRGDPGRVAPARASSTCRTCSARLRRCARWACARSSLRWVRAGARALRAGGRGPGLRRARGLRPHAGLARERAAGGARARTGRVHVVFGAGGDRDRGKRPLMGAAAAAARRPRDRDLGQPALGAPGRDHRRDPGGSRAERRARARPPPRDRARRGGRRGRATWW